MTPPQVNPSPNFHSRTPRSISARTVAATLLLIAAFLGFYNYLWLRADWPFPSHPWYAGSFYPVMSLFELVKSLDFTGTLKYLFKSDNADIYALFAAAVMTIRKSHPAVIMLVNLPCLIFGIFFVFKLGETLFDRPTGLLAAILFSLYPSVYGMSRQYCEEFIVTCISVAAVWCLVKSNGFRDVRYSIGFAITFALGLLVKYAAFVYLIGPIAVVGAASLRKDKPLLKVWPNLAITIVLTLAISGPKYFVPENIRAYVIRPVCNPSPYPWYSFINLEPTALGAIVYHLSLPFFLLWFASCIALFRNADAKTKWLLLLWTILPWLALTFMPHIRNAYYLIFFTPPMALVSSYGLVTYLKKCNRRVSVSILSAILALGLLQFYDFSFGTPLNFERVVWGKVNGQRLHYYKTSDAICRPPQKEQAVLDSLVRLKDLSAGQPVALPLSPADPWGNHVWPVVFWLNDIKFVELPYYENFQTFDFKTLNDTQSIFFTPTKSDPDLESWFRNTLDRAADTIKNHAGHPYFQPVDKYSAFVSDQHLALISRWHRWISDFRLVNELSIRDGIVMRVYRRLKSSTPGGLHT